MTKRPYQLRKRAESQAETRQKIVDATIRLHQDRGAVNTSMADIAALAGVGKVTVYRHFPDLASLFGACSSHYYQTHPFPDPAEWRSIADPVARLRHGLNEAYAYHVATEAMMNRAFSEVRDHVIMTRYHDHWRRAAEILLEPWLPRSDEKELLAGLVLALSFENWRIMVRDQGLSQDEAIALMERLTNARVDMARN
jgi:AcrR family transcriptional regulator